MENKPSLFEKFIKDIKRIWRIAPRGLILWNACIIAVLTLSIFISFEVFIIAQIFGSFIAFGVMLDNDLSGSSSPRNLWTLATGFALVILIFMVFVGIIQFVYRWTFGYLIEQDEIRRLKFEQEEREAKKTKQKYQNLLENKNKEKKDQKLLGN